jgi:hypothetical protein
MPDRVKDTSEDSADRYSGNIDLKKSDESKGNHHDYHTWQVDESAGDQTERYHDNHPDGCTNPQKKGLQKTFLNRTYDEENFPRAMNFAALLNTNSLSKAECSFRRLAPSVP